MAKRSCVERLVNDELWALVEPLLPPHARGKRGRTGRPRVPDRAALAGIMFVLRTGISWNDLPPERSRVGDVANPETVSKLNKEAP